MSKTIESDVRIFKKGFGYFYAVRGEELLKFRRFEELRDYVKENYNPGKHKDIEYGEGMSERQRRTIISTLGNVLYLHHISEKFKKDRVS